MSYINSFLLDAQKKLDRLPSVSSPEYEKQLQQEILLNVLIAIAEELKDIKLILERMEPR